MHPELKHPELAELYGQVQEKRLEVERNANMSTWQKARQFATFKYQTFVRGMTMVRVAVESIVTQKSFESVFNATVGFEELSLEELSAQAQ